MGQTSIFTNKAPAQEPLERSGKPRAPGSPELMPDKIKVSFCLSLGRDKLKWAGWTNVSAQKWCQSKWAMEHSSEFYENSSV